MNLIIRKYEITCLSLFIIQFYGCSDSENPAIDENPIAELSTEDQILALPVNEFEGSELISLYAEAMKEVLEMAEDANFRSFVYKRAALQNSGDYDIFLDDIVKGYKEDTKLGKSASKLESLSSKISARADGLRPIVFFPRAETLEETSRTNKGFDASKAMSSPVAVINGATNTDHSVPGFKLSGGKLVSAGNITEDYAWDNDVYVIGAEERIAQRGCENFQKANCGGGGTGGGGSSANTRTEGRRELGGHIKIHNLNTVEHWMSGKLELRVVVGGGMNGGAMLIDYDLGKHKRKNFKDGKWYNMGNFYFNWRTPAIGILNVEQWWELDGGKSAETTISIPGTAATSTTPATGTTTVKFPSEDRDDKLTTAPVQFLDKISEVYGAGNLYFQRN